MARYAPIIVVVRLKPVSPEPKNSLVRNESFRSFIIDAFARIVPVQSSGCL
jgi:hypothetical protein